MHFLASSLQGRALECVKKLAITADNFDIAWQALVKRFENRRRLIKVHLNTLLNLAVIPRESASDLEFLRDQVNTAVASLTNLQRSPEELWNDILIHIVTQKLDPVTRKAWSMRICDDTELPSFDDFSRFLDGRTRGLDDESASQSTQSQVKIIVSTRSCCDHDCFLASLMSGM